MFSLWMQLKKVMIPSSMTDMVIGMILDMIASPSINEFDQILTIDPSR
jgi:hypothetical protein